VKFQIVLSDLMSHLSFHMMVWMYCQFSSISSEFAAAIKCRSAILKTFWTLPLPRLSVCFQHKPNSSNLHLVMLSDLSSGARREF
jgi:hypothetical protein